MYMQAFATSGRSLQNECFLFSETVLCMFLILALVYDMMFFPGTSQIDGILIKIVQSSGKILFKKIFI